MWATVAAAVTAVATAVVIIVSSETAACSGSSPNWTSSADTTSLQSCVNSASDGDTITVSGTATYTAGIIIPSGKGLTIIGTGTPENDAADRGASADCDNVVITDNFTTSPAALFSASPDYGSSLTRISCMKFESAMGVGANALSPIITVDGTCDSTTCPQIRIDNLTFASSLSGKTNPSNTMIITDDVFGVLDHNTQEDATEGGFQFVNYSNNGWKGVGEWGDNSWATPLTFGTVETLYIENNVFGDNVLPGETEGGGGGGRVAMRFNTCNGCYAGISNHGTESNGRPRGGLQIEFYGNDYECQNTSQGCQGAVPIRSGVALVFGNNLTVAASAFFNSYLGFANNSSAVKYAPWEACDGAGAFDENDGTTYYSGMVVSGGGTTTITVSGSPGWTTDQWLDVSGGIAYSLHDVTQDNGGQIIANGSNTLELVTTGSGPNTWFPANSDSIEIRRAISCIDQNSRSNGDYISGNPPTPAQPINQELTPSYEWNNSGAAPSFGNVARFLGLQWKANRDWYTDNSNGTPVAQSSNSSPFNGDGTPGVGFGTIANRPPCMSGCLDGVGYWATDEGEWDSTNGATADGKMYVWNGSAWVAQYGSVADDGLPYCYPHPKISGVACDQDTGGGAPAAEKVMIR